jgi:hypothetical protein
MPAPRGRARGGSALFALLALAPIAPTSAAPLSQAEIAQLCAQADDSSHCGRLIEEVQLKRLPALAVRDGSALKVSLYPAGNATFTDTETLHGGRSYSLWDYIDPINAVLLYTTDNDQVTFTLLQRASGSKAELPTEPVLSPDRQRLATADFCPERCTNELALWRVARDGIRKESSWKPPTRWSDAGVKWKDADTLVIEYTTAASDKPAQLEKRLSDAGWIKAPSR